MAISDTIQSMYENVGEVYDTITNVTLPEHKNIENIPRTIRDSYLEIINNGINVIYDNWDKVTGEGTSLTLNNTLEAKMKIVLNGNTSQFTTTGKNLEPNTANSWSGSGMTFKKNEDGSWTLNGTNNTGDTFYYSLANYYTLPAGTYTLSNGNTSVSSSGVIFYDDNYNFDRVNISTKTFNSNVTIKPYIRWSSGSSVSNLTIYPMIEAGSSATTYEPYTGGIASPNPDYPQDIHVVSGDNTIEICGRNLGNPNTLFDEMYNSGYANPPTRTIVDNRNVISFSTYYSHNKPLYVTKYKENTQYTFRVVAKAAESALRYLYIIIDYTDGTKSSTSIPNQGTSWDELRIVSTANKTIKDFFFSYSNAGYWYIDEDSFNIIEGDTTDYETYQGASYPVNLPVENLFDESQLLQADGWTYSNGYYNGLVEKYYVAFRYGFNFNTTFEENTQYTIKLNAYTTGGNPRFKIEYTDGTNYMMNFTETTPTDYSYTTTNGKTISKIVGEYGTGGGQTLYLKDIMVQKGSKANSYTPYGTTPIELCKIGNYQDKFIRNSGKNLLNRATCEENKVLTWATGITWNDTGSLASDFIKVNIGDKIYANYNYQKMFYDKDKNYLGCLQMDGTVTTGSNGNMDSNFVVPNVSGIVYMRLGLRTSSNPNINLLTANIMVNKGDTLLDYEPYGNGDWYVKKEIGKVVLDGETDGLKFTSAEISRNKRFSLILSDVLKQSYLLNIDNKSNNFTYNTDVYRDGGDEIGFIINSTQLYVRFGSSSELDTITKANAWLSTHNTEVYYVLEKPTYTPIEGELLNQLEAIKMSYEGQTNLSQTNNDMPFILNPSALKKV